MLRHFEHSDVLFLLLFFAIFHALMLPSCCLIAARSALHAPACPARHDAPAPICYAHMSRCAFARLYHVAVIDTYHAPPPARHHGFPRHARFATHRHSLPPPFTAMMLLLTFAMLFIILLLFHIYSLR